MNGYKAPKCPKCGHTMIEDSDYYGDRLHVAYSCLNLNCDYIHSVRLVRCCDCKKCEFDPKDTIPFHCKPMNRCMNRIEIESTCKGYDQRDDVHINWCDDGIIRTLEELYDY
jgi:hypothetical protein